MSLKTSPLKKFFLTRRLSWPTTLSIGLHSTLIAGLLYASAQEMLHMPAEEPEPINVVMVNPAMFAAPAPVAIPQPDAKPEAAPPPPPKE
ncbi:MAG: TonB system transport protein TonB, partial [Enterobacterales bacterium]|nr:TonB system transport protein TonB [Enterobacterales bacterium]